MLLDKWLTALRSGVWKQGKDALATVALDADGGETIAYCCLGVACELSDQVTRSDYADAGDTGRSLYTYYYTDDEGDTFDHTAELPYPVQATLGFRTPSGEFIVDNTLPEELREKVLDIARNATPGTLYTDYNKVTPTGARHRTTLANLNDAGASFGLLADIIAARPTGLFGDAVIPTL